jgi:hypothetical protein
MRHWLSALACIVTLGGCQTPPAPAPTEPTTQRTVLHPGDAALSAVGTPFYLVFKSVFCVASVAIAAPVAGIAALSESRFASEARRDLGDGVSQNCGPPYALRPQPLSDSAGRGGAGSISRPRGIARTATGRSTRTTTGSRARRASCAGGRRAGGAPLTPDLICRSAVSAELQAASGKWRGQSARLGGRPLRQDQGHLGACWLSRRSLMSSQRHSKASWLRYARSVGPAATAGTEKRHINS